MTCLSSQKSDERNQSWTASLHLWPSGRAIMTSTRETILVFRAEGGQARWSLLSACFGRARKGDEAYAERGNAGWEHSCFFWLALCPVVENLNDSTGEHRDRETGQDVAARGGWAFTESSHLFTLRLMLAVSTFKAARHWSYLIGVQSLLLRIAADAFGRAASTSPRCSGATTRRSDRTELVYMPMSRNSEAPAANPHA